MTCEQCGKEMEVGEWPWCPHGKPSLVLHPDSIPGGMVVHNLSSKPQKFYSSTEWRAAVKASGWRQQDGNRFLTNHE